MSEMLGNQYFLVRKYTSATKELEEALRSNPKCKGIRRKLIICFNETGQIRKAFKYFISLINEDIYFIIQTDPVEDDCPCPELVFEAERSLNNNKNSIDFVLRIAMLWLYCDVNESIRYFKQAQLLAPADGDIKTALTLLKSREMLSH